MKVTAPFALAAISSVQGFVPHGEPGTQFHEMLLHKITDSKEDAQKLKEQALIRDTKGNIISLAAARLGGEVASRILHSHHMNNLALRAKPVTGVFGAQWPPVSATTSLSSGVVARPYLDSNQQILFAPNDDFFGGQRTRRSKTRRSKNKSEKTNKIIRSRSKRKTLKTKALQKLVLKSSERTRKKRKISKKRKSKPKK